MAHGGKRTGAGRKEGALTKRTRAIADKAAAEGSVPLDVMLENMRHFQRVAIDAEATLAGLTLEEFTDKHGAELTPADQFKALLAEVKKTAGLRQMARGHGQGCSRLRASQTCQHRTGRQGRRANRGEDH
jgi:hypothetical protein